MTAPASLIRGDAIALPLRDASVDLVVTSPPYWALRSYQDGGEHYDGQIGSEDTPTAFLAALWAALDECWRVLKPTGSVWVNLGDKYAGSGGHNNAAIGGTGRGPSAYSRAADVPAKSLMLLPEQFRLGAVDPSFREWKTGTGGPQWIARAVVVWSKPNGLPESVTDRVRRSHEDWIHLTKQGRYFASIDEIREPYAPGTAERYAAGFKPYGDSTVTANSVLRCDNGGPTGTNPLGKLPGSVWTIPTEPLKVPDWLGVDHFAAFPQEWPRRIILGWSPSGYCTACDESRQAVVEKDPRVKERETPRYSTTGPRHGGAGSTLDSRAPTATLTGYACACPDTTAPVRPAVVLDPFGGTGTTAMVARTLGRHGVHIDLSADYLRLARWRIHDSGHAAKTMRRTNDEAQLTLLA